MLGPDEMRFESAKYTQPQFTFVPSGANLLIGYSYGSRRTFLASVPVAEVGQWLLDHAAQLEQARPRAIPLTNETVEEFLSSLGL